MYVRGYACVVVCVYTNGICYTILKNLEIMENHNTYNPAIPKIPSHPLLVFAIIIVLWILLVGLIITGAYSLIEMI